MTEDKRQQDFAERLRRIEQRKGNAAPQPAARRSPSPDYGYHPTRESHPVRNGIIWACIIAMAGTGAHYGWKAIPPDLTEALAGLTGATSSPGQMESIGSGGDPVPDETPTMSDQGAVLASPAVAHTGPGPVEITQIAMTLDLPTADTAVGAIIPFARNAVCDLRDPLPTEQVVNVRIENALQASPVQAFSDALLADRLLRNVQAITQGNKAYDLDGRVSGQLAALDVFLTDTTQPIYLVLQNMGAGIVWNIHTAPEVTLAHVAIISSSFSALVDPSDNATFEALLVSDFVPPHEFGADDQPRDCMISPWRTPEPDWIGQIKAERGNTLYENQMYSYAKGYEAYNRWYTATLGVDAGTNAVTPRDAAHVLVGPVPATPVAYRSMAGRDIHVMQTDNMFTGDTATRHAITEDLHNALLLAAVGGDAAALDPAPMQRGDQ